MASGVLWHSWDLALLHRRLRGVYLWEECDGMVRVVEWYRRGVGCLSPYVGGFLAGDVQSPGGAVGLDFLERVLGGREDLFGALRETPGEWECLVWAPEGLVGALEDLDGAPYEPPGSWEGLVGALEEPPSG